MTREEKKDRIERKRLISGKGVKMALPPRGCNALSQIDPFLLGPLVRWRERSPERDMWAAWQLTRYRMWPCRRLCLVLPCVSGIIDHQSVIGRRALVQMINFR
jgi:hypothetical protein